MPKYVGADHEFHDEAFVQGWADRFVPTPERLELFDTIIGRVAGGPLPVRHVVELGIGPGYLAERLLGAIPDVTYEGVDFSAPMLEIAARRLHAFADRLRCTRADLLRDDWREQVAPRVGAVVSTWALHDLGGEAVTRSVYAACRALLPAGGILLNGDFVKPDGTVHDYEPGRFPVSRHLELLREVGFRDARCLVFLERELDDPTSAQNYACIEAVA
jgi:predicted TPR repeat methyltransferase